MSAKNPVASRAKESEETHRQQVLQTLVQDLEGVERLQQMQSRLLREVMQAIKNFDLA